MMIETFTPQQLADDIRYVHDYYTNLFLTLTDADWQRPTEANGWTLHETVAHLDAAAEAYQQTIEAIRSQTAVDFAKFSMYRREDLPTVNETQNALRTQQPIPKLCASFLNTLQTAAASAHQSHSDELLHSYLFPVYNRPITLGELYAGQATHPGLVHAAQVANGANIPYLWRQYDPALLKRQITYMLHFMSLSYWPQRGNMQTTINFIVPGQASWHLRLSLKGCEVHEGKGERPSLTVWFRTLDVLCRTLTLQISPIRATLTGQTFAWGRKLLLVFQLEHLFNPTGTW